jgi:Ca2+-binding RTX toxin-like protein
MARAATKTTLKRNKGNESTQLSEVSFASNERPAWSVTSNGYSVDNGSTTFKFIFEAGSFTQDNKGKYYDSSTRKNLFATTDRRVFGKTTLIEEQDFWNKYDLSIGRRRLDGEKNYSLYDASLGTDSHIHHWKWNYTDKPAYVKEEWAFEVTPKKGTKNTGPMTLDINLFDQHSTYEEKISPRDPKFDYFSILYRSDVVSTGCVDIDQDIKDPDYYIIEGTGGRNSTATTFEAVFDGGDPIPVCGDQKFLGTDLTDSITGGSNNDTIDGGKGNDTIEGGGGDDQLTGGSGVDQFVIGTASSGNDIIQDFDPAKDLLVFKTSDLLRFTENTLDGGLRSLEIARLQADNNLDTFNGTVTLKGVSFEDFSTALDANNLGVSLKSNQVLLPIKDENGRHREFVRTLNEGIEDDYNNIVGTNEVDTAETNAGMRDDAENDDNPGKFIGSEKDDYMQGLDGADQLFGKEGDDLLNGGTGADTLNGGEGDDDFIVGLETAVINAGDDNDSFYNTDKALGFQSIKMGEGKDTLTNIGQLKVDGNINMGAGDDILTTNLLIAADELDGGKGDDTLILNDVKEEDITGDDLKGSDGFVIKGFETINQTSGTWEYAGKFKQTDVLIDGGRAQITLSKPNRAGLTVDRFNIINEAKLIIDVSAMNDSNRNETWSIINGEVDEISSSKTLFKIGESTLSLDDREQADQLTNILGGTPELAITDKGLMLSILI